MQTIRHHEIYPELWDRELLEYEGTVAELLDQVPSDAPIHDLLDARHAWPEARWGGDSEIEILCRDHFATFAICAVVVHGDQRWIRIANGNSRFLIGPQPPNNLEDVLPDDSGFVLGFYGLREDVPKLGGYFLPTDDEGSLIRVSDRFSVDRFRGGHDGVIVYRPYDATCLVVEESSKRVSWLIEPEWRFVEFCRGYLPLARQYLSHESLSYY